MNANEYLAEVRSIAERASKATPGPWNPSYAGWRGCYTVREVYTKNDGEFSFYDKKTAAFIAASRTDVPRLCQIVEELAAEVERLREEARELREDRDSLLFSLPVFDPDEPPAPKGGQS